jgi:pimeloyl-ACP methyl ester carboxylesterase
VGGVPARSRPPRDPDGVDPAAFGRASAEAPNGIAVPTLVLQGENDVLVEPASAAKFASAIPGAKLILYPRVGHLPQIEIPERSASDVAEFLQAQH